MQTGDIQRPLHIPPRDEEWYRRMADLDDGCDITTISPELLEILESTNRKEDDGESNCDA